MPTAADYLTYLARNGVKLWVDQGQLRYHAKKGVISSEDLARLRSMRSEIIAELGKTAASAVDGLNRSPATNPIEGPVSFQQLWFLELFERYPSWKTTLSYAFHLKGLLDHGALEKSFAALLRDHPSLRTKIAHVCGEWRQEIQRVDGFKLPITPVSGRTETEKNQKAQQMIRAIGTQELDPGAGRLMTAQMIQVSPNEHFLVILIHRLGADCLAITQVFRDFWVLYSETAPEGFSTTSEEPPRYRDYALWQHSTNDAWRQKHATYWNDYLAGAQAIRWPSREHTPGVEQSVVEAFKSLETPFGPALSADIKEFGRQTHTLPSLIMLSVYVTFVWLGSRERDFVIPFVIAGRGATHEGIVGCFSHVVYLRIRLQGSESFTKLLQLVSNEFYRAAAFRQDFGRAATDRPELLGSALCQWTLWHPADIGELQPPSILSNLGIEVQKIRCQNLDELTNVPHELVDLEVNFFDSAGNITALTIYRMERFSEVAIAQLMQDLRSVAERVIQDPSMPLYSQNVAGL